MAEREAGSGRVVLVVDDEELVRNVTRMMLERLGCSVRLAASGPEALALVAEGWRPDLVVMDMTMPGLSGVETHQQLRAIDPDMRVILCSGFGEDDALDRFGEMGLSGFLQKPFQLPRLKEMLDRVLG